MIRGLWLTGGVFVALQGQAFGQTSVGSVGPWAIIDVSEACSMQARTPDQTSIAFVVQKSDPNDAQLRLANPNWRSLAQQPKIEIDVMIDGRRQPLNPVSTFSTASESGILIPFRRGYMRKVFTERATVAVFYRSSELMLLYLNDQTKQAAFQAVRDCAGDRHDPFAAK